MSSAIPRVAVFGFHLEANAFCPPTPKSDCVQQCWETGTRISELARAPSALPAEIGGFYERMDAYGPWTPVPLIVLKMPPGGPASGEMWAEFMRELEARLREALPVDAVYACNHGASCAEGEPDSEGAMLALVRRLVGDAVPVVATHDLHCNVSDRTAEIVDALVGYRTNPHVDMRARGAEVADLLREILGGTTMTKAFIRLPLTPPTVTLLTAQGPYADLIWRAEAMMQAPQDGPIANVSVSGGFVFSDLPHCGMSVMVTARDDLAAARHAALQLAETAWAERERYVVRALSVEEAVALARTSQVPRLFADVADNPGGGGGGNTAWMLRAFAEAGIENCVLGVFVDAALAAEAHRLGEGARFTAVFNRNEQAYAKTYTHAARVLKLCSGERTGRRGLLAGQTFSLGESALLELEGTGMRVVVGSLRRQLADPVMLEMHGLDIARIGTLIVKSRGHYRAGFDEYFDNAHIHDVDSPGLTTPNLAHLDFKQLPRPVFPLDPEAAWQPPEWGGAGV